MDSLIETFHIDLKIIIAQAVNFIIVLVVLYFFALKPLKKIMDERAKTIEGGINDAKKNAETLKATKAEYDAAMRQARLEVQTLFETSKKEVVAQREEMLDKARNEAGVILEAGRKALEADKAKMLNDAKNELASLVIIATEKVLQEKNKN